MSKICPVKNLDIDLWYHNSSLIFLITCIPLEDTDFAISHFRNFQTSMTLTLDQVIWHDTVVHHSLTSTYIPYFVKIGKTFSGWMDTENGHWDWLY